jgi:hypothetical protein
MFGFDKAREVLGSIESKAKALLSEPDDIPADSVLTESIFWDDFETLKVIFDTK